MKKTIGISAFLIIIVGSTPLFSYDGEVHEMINEKAVDSITIDINKKLIEKLAVADGISAELMKDGVLKTIKEWTVYGGKAEDFGKTGNGDIKDKATTRAMNHFHNPLKDWENAGLDNFLLEFYWSVLYSKDPVSAVLWGLNPGEQDFSGNTTGDWSWGSAKENYYIYLTGKDFTGTIVSDTADEKNANFADCFRALGQVMHLLQDMSVPLHTRNDVHILPLGKMESFKALLNYETYTKKNKKFLDYTSQPPDLSIFSSSNPDPDFAEIAPVSSLFDRNQYTSTNPDPSLTLNFSIGLAEYSNANFFTDDTMFSDFPNPSIENTEIYFDPDNWGLYLSDNGDGEDVVHLARLSFLKLFRDMYYPPHATYIPATTHW